MRDLCCGDRKKQDKGETRQGGEGDTGTNNSNKRNRERNGSKQHGETLMFVPFLARIVITSRGGFTCRYSNSCVHFVMCLLSKSESSEGKR